MEPATGLLPPSLHLVVVPFLVRVLLLRKKGFSQWLIKAGFVEADLSAEQLDVLEAGYTPTQEASPALDQVLAAARTREQKHAKFSEIIAGAIDQGMSAETAQLLVEAAKKDDMDPVQFELQVLRASRPSGNSYAPSRGGQHAPEVIEAAFAKSCMMESDWEKAYPEQMVEAACSSVPSWSFACWTFAKCRSTQWVPRHRQPRYSRAPRSIFPTDSGFGTWSIDLRCWRDSQQRREQGHSRCLHGGRERMDEDRNHWYRQRPQKA